ncbi:unnamed protein product [Alternaria burnsii]|nr:unnamed protein product [Alternaria burnsii]
MAGDGGRLISLDDPECPEFEPEIVKAFERALYGVTSFTKYILKRVIVLNRLLKNIKQYSVELLKKEIDDAEDFTTFWDRLESEQRWPLSGSDIHETVSLTHSETHEHKYIYDDAINLAKSAILATILHTFLGTRDLAVWLNAKMNIANQSKNGSLLVRAFDWGLADTVELLLVSGADPRNVGSNILLRPIRGFMRLNSDELHFVISAHLFLKLIPMSHYRSFKADNAGAKSMVRARRLRKDVGPFRPEDIQKPSLTWIHVRRNNVVLMMTSVRIYTWKAAQTLGEIFGALRRDSDDLHLTYLEPTYQSRSLQMPEEKNIFSRREPCEATCSAIVFPYLVLTTIGRQKVKRQRHEKLNSDLKRNKDLLIFDHLERTLDEAYYPGLSREALEVRNHDQVVSHSKDDFDSFDKRESGSKKVDAEAFILMVPQLWLYRLGNVVISAYSMPQGTQYAFNHEWRKLQHQRYDGRDRATPADIHLGLIITSFIDSFGKSYYDYDDELEYPAPLDLFETRVVHLLSEVRKYIEQPSGGKSSSSGLEYRRERYFIHVISDVRSELGMIQHVLAQQERILKQFLKDCLPKSEKQQLPDWAPIEASQETIQQYMRRVKKIDGDANRIEKSIQDMLNLKRTHASIRDAHSSLIVSTAVIGFTVITIVFTPLAFLTALFALKIDGFEKLQISGSDGVFHSAKIGGIFASTEILTLVLTGFAVWGAFKYINRDQERSWKEKSVAWLKGFISRSKGQSRKKRAKVADIESSRPDELQGSTASFTDSLSSMESTNKATPIRSASAATWPMGRKTPLKHPHSKGRGKVVDLELSRQGEPQEPTSFSENPNLANAPHTPRVENEVTSIRSI